MRLLTFVLASFLGSALAPVAAGDDEPHKIYECTDATGNTVYQDDPCTEIAAAPSPAPSKAAAPAKQKPPKKSKAVPKPAAPQAAPLRFVVPKTGPPELPSHQLPVSNRTIDGRWQTPDAALKAFVAAVASGDRTAIVSCLTDSALADWGPEAEALPLDELRKTVGSFTGYVAEGDLGPYWSIRALRSGMRPKWIFFERNGDGEWKIGAL